MDEKRDLATNRQARYKFQLVRSLEAGISLLGHEVKSLRAGGAQLRDSYARVKRGELFLYHCHISPYGNADPSEQDPLRVRKLLVHRREILRLERDTRSAGHTLVPLRFYLKDGRIKVEIALARGKKAHDKRDAERRRDHQQEIKRALGKRR